MLKKLIIEVALASVTVVLIVGIIYFVSTLGARRLVENGTLSRNIMSIFNYFPEEPYIEDREVAWSSELPKVVRRDIEYLRKKDNVEKIIYNFYDWRITIWIESDGILRLRIKDYQTLSYLRNFSIYQGNNALVIYGYEGPKMEYFVKYTIEADDFNFDYITYNASIPFSERDSKVISYDGNELKMCFSDKNQVYVYKGNEIVSNKYDIGEHKDVFNNGMFVTTDDKLKMAYLVVNGNQADIKIEEIGEVQYEYEFPYRSKYITVLKDEEDDEILIQTFSKDDGVYVPVPRDWKTYIQTIEGKTIENPNYGIDLIKLDKNVFISADFRYEDTYEGNWLAEIKLNLNGKEALYSYYVNGFDKEVDRPKELPFEFTAETPKEFWEIVSKIRTTYEKYYDYPAAND